MQFEVRAGGRPGRLAIFPGAFHPPTVAHIAMAEAALETVDEVVFVLPRVFPHKEYTAAGFEERMELLRAALAARPRFSLASSERGLFVDLAQEARSDYGIETELFLLCGRDAAERIVNWDYGEGHGIERQLTEYRLLVASRGGRYEAPEELRERVVSIGLSMDEISSSEVRRRIAAGEEWRRMVPGPVARLMEGRIDLWS